MGAMRELFSSELRPLIAGSPSVELSRSEATSRALRDSSPSSKRRRGRALRPCPRCGGETEDDNLNWRCKVCGAWLS